MKKKLITTAFASVLGISTLTAQPSFSYKYKITANSNSAGDLLTLYEVKQDFLTTYNNLILTVNEVYHEQTIKDNLTNFIDESIGNAKYENDKIIIIIGEGKGNSLEGDLKRNICDNETTNYRIYLFDLLFG